MYLGHIVLHTDRQTDGQCYLGVGTACVYPGAHHPPHRQTDRQTDRQTVLPRCGNSLRVSGGTSSSTQTDRQTDGQTCSTHVLTSDMSGSYPSRKGWPQTDRQTDRLTDRLAFSTHVLTSDMSGSHTQLEGMTTDRQTDTDRQTVWHRQTERQTCITHVLTSDMSGSHTQSEGMTTTLTLLKSDLFQVIHLSYHFYKTEQIQNESGMSSVWWPWDAKRNHLSFPQVILLNLLSKILSNQKGSIWWSLV